MSAARRALFGVVLGALAIGLASDGAPLHWFAVSGPPVLAQAPATQDPPDPTPSPSDSPSPSPSPSPSASPSRAPSPSPSARRAGTATRPSTGTTTPPANLASRLHTLPAGTTQVIVAYASGYGVTTGTLETFQKVNGFWQPALGAMAMRLGTNGFSDSKAEGDLTTPTGMYRIGGTVYGIAANPGVRYAYHQLVADDWWDENVASSSYNSFVHGTDPGGGSEALWQTSPQYTYFAVIDYNIPVVAATPARGSGIFLHVSAGRATAGCLALAQSDLVAVLRWLNPAANPRIVMAPSSALGRY